MIGFRIYPRAEGVDPALVSQFRNLPTANVSDVMSRLAAGGASLRPYHAGGPLCGPAFTVKTRPGDNLMIHKALDIAHPGDVLIVDGGADLTNALVGELMLTHARKRGLGGIVLNGAIRDLDWIRQNDFPVYAAGVTHRGPYKDGPGEINVTVAFGGMVIRPGDLVLGDADGIVCVPQGEAQAVCEAAQQKAQAEARQMAAIEAGTSDRSWIDTELTRRNCEYMD
jgi:RraA family protein